MDTHPKPGFIWPTLALSLWELWSALSSAQQWETFFSSPSGEPSRLSNSFSCNPTLQKEKGGKTPPLRDSLQVWGRYLATAQRPVSKGGPGEKTLGWGDRASLKTPFQPKKNNKENTNRINLENSQVGLLPSTGHLLSRHISTPSNTPGDYVLPPVFPMVLGPSPCPGLTHTGLDTQLPPALPPQAPTVVRCAGTFAVRD